MLEIWQTILHSNLINFIIVLSILIFIFKKLNVVGKIDNLKNDIKNSVEMSVSAKKIAEQDLVNIKEKLTNLPKEIQDIRNSAKNNVEGMSHRIAQEIEQNKKDIQNNTNRIMDLEVKNFKDKLSDILSDASLNLSRKNAVEQLQNNRDLHDKYIYEAINELDRINL